MLIQAVQLLRKIQSEIDFLRIQEKQRIKRRNQLFPRISIPSTLEQQEFHTLFHSFPGSAVLISVEGTIMDANDEFRHSLHLSRHQVIGASLFTFAHLSNLLLLYSSFSLLLSGGSSMIRAVQLFPYKGLMTPHVVSVTLAKNKSGSLFLVMFTPLLHKEQVAALCGTVELVKKRDVMRSSQSSCFRLSNGQVYCLLDQTVVPCSLHVSLDGSHCADAAHQVEHISNPALKVDEA